MIPECEEQKYFNEIVFFLTFVVNYFSRASQYEGETRANDGKLDGQLIQSGGSEKINCRERLLARRSLALYIVMHLFINRVLFVSRAK